MLHPILSLYVYLVFDAADAGSEFQDRGDYPMLKLTGH